MNQPTNPLPAVCARVFLAGLCTVCVLGVTATTAMAETPVKKGEHVKKAKSYALIVANNGSVDGGVKALRYADDDGARYYETFSHIADETTLLTVLDADTQRVFPDLATKTRAPSREALSNAVSKLALQLEEDRKQGIHAEVYLVFTGHGHVDADGQGYLSLSDGKLTRRDLYKQVIAPLNADYTHLIIDACHAYFMVQSRGDGESSGWQDDRSGESHDAALSAYLQDKRTSPEDDFELKNTSTLGVILSTSGTAEVHEWSKLRAGVFSHQLRSALLGGADVDQDGKITYLEIEAFLAAANASVTNPRARISVFARPPAQDQNHALLSIDNFRDATTLTLPGMQGRYELEDARGLRYADFHTSPEQVTRVVLLHDPVGQRPYFIRRNDAEQATLVMEDQPSLIDGDALAFAQLDSSARSSVEESFRSELFSTPYGPGFFAGYRASRQRYDSVLATQGTARQLAAAEPPRAWSRHVQLSYGVSGALSEEIYGESAIQHNMVLGYNFLSNRTGLSVGPFLGYGLTAQTLSSAGDASAITHRVALGVEGAWRRDVSSTVFFEPRLRLGQQLLLLRNDTLCDTSGTCSDPLGVRGEALLSFGMRPQGFGRVALRLDLGATADVFSRAGVERNSETLYWTPTAAIGVTF